MAFHDIQLVFLGAATNFFGQSIQFRVFKSVCRFPRGFLILEAQKNPRVLWVMIVDFSRNHISSNLPAPPLCSCYFFLWILTWGLQRLRRKNRHCEFQGNNLYDSLLAFCRYLCHSICSNMSKWLFESRHRRLKKKLRIKTSPIYPDLIQWLWLIQPK